MRSELSRIEMALIRLCRRWQKHWPIPRGRAIPVRALALLQRVGLFNPVWHLADSGFWMHLDPKDLIQREILTTGGWEPSETAFLRRRLGRGSAFLDIGANIGYFSLVASSLVGTEGSVLSVEPNPRLSNSFHDAIIRNRITNISLSRVACAHDDGVRTLFFGPYSNSGRASLSAENAMSSAGTPVQCIQADRLVSDAKMTRLDLVKIDVEGAELTVLRGLANTLARFRPSLLIEMEPERLKPFGTSVDDVRHFLSTFGYIETPINNGNFAFEVRGN